MTDSNAPSKAQDVKAIRLVLPFLWPPDDRILRIRLVGSIVLLVASAAINAYMPMLFAGAIDHFKAAEALGAAITAPIAILLAYGAMNWFGRSLHELRWALYGPIEQRLRRCLGLITFRHLHDLSLRFHLSRRTGTLSRILDNGMHAVEELLFSSVFVILPLAAEVVFVCGVLVVLYEPVFPAIMLGTLALYTFTLVIGSEWLRKHQRRAVAVGAMAQGKAVDSLLNYETIKFFGNERHVAGHYDDALEEVETLTVRALTWRSLTGLVQVAILAGGITLMVITAARAVAAGAMTIGDLVLVNMYLFQLIRPLERLGSTYRNIKKSLTDLELMMGLLDEKPEIEDDPDAEPLPPGPGELRFENVCFAYDQRRPVLHDLSFTVPEGHTVALVGPSGAGKSTIGRLLFRFYDVDSGCITIDGADIRHAIQDSVRAAIAVVPQDTVLFNETIHYNIAFGRPGCTHIEVEEAARLAQIHDFIVSLPDGYDSLVGERGLKLSGGEKQRIAIARAVLKHPRMFLFDEATSALDSHTEQDIQANLRAVSSHTTTLIIAHRLSTVVHASEILFIESGRIRERGPHEALLERDGLYAAMWRRQLKTRPVGIETAAE
ncbi:MAG: ABCB family ABC transporter ATP-binding protein/permease [Alphaproteobacteria bacterium]